MARCPLAVYPAGAFQCRSRITTRPAATAPSTKFLTSALYCVTELPEGAPSRPSQQLSLSGRRTVLAFHEAIAANSPASGSARQPCTQEYSSPGMFTPRGTKVAPVRESMSLLPCTTGVGAVVAAPAGWSETRVPVRITELIRAATTRCAFMACS